MLDASKRYVVSKWGLTNMHNPKTVTGSTPATAYRSTPQLVYLTDLHGVKKSADGTYHTLCHDCKKRTIRCTYSGVIEYRLCECFWSPDQSIEVQAAHGRRSNSSWNTPIDEAEGRRGRMAINSCLAEIGVVLGGLA